VSRAAARPPRVLVVEDEVHLAEGLRFNLEAEGYEVEVAADGRAALEQLLRGERGFDLMILDLMLPELGGLEVARRARAAGNFVPILILTAKDDPADVVRGIEEGGDDYLTKPFVLAELLARARALLRRRRWDGSAEEAPRSQSFGDVTVHFDRFEVEGPAGRIELTTREMALLRALIEREGRAVPRGELLEEVWGLRPDTRTRVVDSFVARLRRYLERDPSRPRHILSVRGHGYKFIR
jgi:DNA-binding response OmpR family regulator